MSKSKIETAIVMLGVMSFLYSISYYLLNGHMSVDFAIGSVQSADKLGESVVKIVRDSTTSYDIVNNETEFIDTFHTNYTMSGSKDSLLKSWKNVISMIQDDFNKSPVIGYVTTGNASALSPAGSQDSGILVAPNPFADSAAINQTLRQALQNTLWLVERTELPYVTAKCDFGMNITKYTCMTEGYTTRNYQELNLNDFMQDSSPKFVR
jgi:hypothetical protein